MKTKYVKFYIGLDVHNDMTAYAVRLFRGDLVLSGGCATRFEDLFKILEPYLFDCKICLESCTNYYHVYWSFKEKGFDICVANTISKKCCQQLLFIMAEHPEIQELNYGYEYYQLIESKIGKITAEYYSVIIFIAYHIFCYYTGIYKCLFPLRESRLMFFKKIMFKYYPHFHYYVAKVNVGIFGATGEVGQEIIQVLDNLQFSVDKLFLYAGKSAGKSLKTLFGKIVVQKADTADYSQLDLAFWAIGGDWSKANWEKAKDFGCYVVDNSSAFRYDDNIPLIVPEINGDLLQEQSSRLIANPNCTTSIAAIPLHILDQIAGIKRIIFSTYQSASGAGNGGSRELLEQSRNYLDGKIVEYSKFQHPLPYNVIPHIDEFQDNRYTKEEMKTDWETRKILKLDDSVRISSGCVRVPVERSHAEDITIETQKPVDLNEYRTALANEPMLKVCDDSLNNIYPMPLNTSGNYRVEVGRIRHPEVFDNGVRMFVCGDQLLRGAALNAVLIAQKLYELGKFD